MKKKVEHFKKGEVFITYKISTDGGNSGSPVLALRNGQHIVLAIHVGADKDENLGKLIDDEVAINICKWEQEMRDSSISVKTNQEKIIRWAFLEKLQRKNNLKQICTKQKES